ncbi:MAG: glycoside hydrolase family 3 protein [Deltaproteobacteria bacterium]|nr:glycoside hydrolase family 3 protein [Deltaproteobacteria bacterium]
MPAVSRSTLPIGELFVLGFRGYAVPRWLENFAARFGLGGVILFDYDVQTRLYERNVRDPAQVKALCAEVAALPSGPLVFVDQEGGRVRRLKERLGFSPLPSARAFGALPPTERASLAQRAFTELRALGIHYDLAPVIDLDYDPASPDIGALERSFGADPLVVRENVRLLDTAAREARIGLCLKHYPGLGAARVNSHEELTDLTGTVTEAQLRLFHELAGDIHGGAVLVSHGIVAEWEPKVPASLSSAALGRLRRAAPEALLVSDDLQMQGLQRFCTTEMALRRGFSAGLDVLLMGNNLLDESTQMAALAKGLAGTVAGDPALSAAFEASLERIRARKALLS